MHETNDDLTALQRLLDASYARAGEHLRMIWVYDFDWDAEHPDAPYARIDAATMLAFKHPD
jgi:hypothetical protein